MNDKTVLLAAIVLGLLSFLLDSKILSAATAIQHPYISYIMEWFSDLSSLISVMAVLASLFMWEERKKKWILVVWLSLIASFAVSIVMKLAVARPRPGLYESLLLSQYSFPSLHAALAFSLVPVLDKEFPKLKWFWMAFAFLVAASRLYLKAHYLSDVVWGVIIGYAIGTGFVRLKEGKLKWKGILRLS